MKLLWSCGTHKFVGVYLYLHVFLNCGISHRAVGGYSTCGYLKYFDKNVESMHMHMY